MNFDYKSLTLSQIIDDLNETFCDLVINVGQSKFEPFLEVTNNLNLEMEKQPSQKLIEIMNKLLEYDSNQLNPKAYDLFKDAIAEIEKII
jgi:hypothetical protein